MVLGDLPHGTWTRCATRCARRPPQIDGAEPKGVGLAAPPRARRGPGDLVDAERAIRIVFNFDQQAITDAFYFDTFATLGVNLGEIQRSAGKQDLSDRGPELKATVNESLHLFIDSSQSMHEVFTRCATPSSRPTTP